MKIVNLEWFTKDEAFPFFIQYGGHDEDTDLHKHNGFTEMVIVLEGNATHIVNSESFFIKKGDVIVLNEGTGHAYKNPNNFKICNIMYRHDILPSAAQDLRTSSEYRILHAYSSKLSLSISSFKYVLSLISAMIDEHKRKLKGYQAMLISQFLSLVVNLSRQYDITEKGMTRNQMYLTNVISYIEDHYNEPLTIEKIAAQTDISARHLNRIFQTYYQMTPISYLQTIRLERACSLLTQTDLSISEISGECGFNDSNYFTRQFTRAYGQSPKAYRLSRISYQHERNGRRVVL
ncbi:AraC family transcriptional regulator [Paenibacillus sp. N4]|uniref:AraC family transcriptional regulator n=1 Tax=Paenibacillus vietnamensis TaxID=2590547 RepID=UPI001CD04777|nr:AraC family transcriptional regulator [Paenibacillus vietnamensis]MCA0755048.1 AraC family transcriptional regulator [Paenibacillus vietnamensis]